MNPKLVRVSALPRKILRKVAQIYSDPTEISWEALPKLNIEASPSVSKTKNAPRIALVKQDVYPDLYCCETGLSAAETIFSSLKRTGFVALFTRLHADFYIVKTEDDSECNLWKEKWFDCQQETIAQYEALKTTPFMDGARGHIIPQGRYARACEEIDWSAYDIVIGLDVPVPARITRRFPSVVWCYCISEPCMRSYGRSHKEIIAGYDLFLNQHYRCLPENYKLPAHEIEFPYFFQYYGCFAELLGRSAEQEAPNGIMVESHTAMILSQEQRAALEKLGPVEITTGSVEQIIRSLVRSKYFVRLGGRKLWGNAMVEAIAAGCLALGNPQEYHHRCLFTPETQITNFDEMLSKISDFERNPDRYRAAVTEQRERVDYLCFARPLHHLLEAAAKVRATR